MIIITTIHTVLFVIFGLPLVYLAFLTFAALAAQSETAATFVRRRRRFAIVVPAHNEEIAIRKTLRSLKDIDYPPELADIIVVADNCTDATAELARSEGAIVMERRDTQLRGKGYALRWCFDALLKDEANGYEAIVVIDADTVVSGNYLTMLNVAIEAGAKVMQTSDLVEPCPSAWTAEALRLGFLLYNYVRPLGRHVLGLSAGLRGNGMCFTRSVLQAVPWHAFSKAEDLEYGLQMLIAGYTVRFVPEAVALATMPQQAENAESQRARWEGGRIGVIRRYTGKLFASAVRNRSLVSIDALIDLATPAFVNMMAVSILMCTLSSAAWAWDFSGAGVFAIAWLCALCAGAFHVGGGLTIAGDPSLNRTLAAIPRYVLWKLLLYLKLANKERSKEWVRTTRESVPGHTTINTSETLPPQI